jgi:Zn-dependent peptidase ImmA (M78 family)
VILPLDTLRPFLASAPVDVSGAATALGIAVIPAANLDPHEALNLESDDDGRWRAFISRHLRPEQVRFAIAHVIAHWILHRDLVDPLVAGKRILRESLTYRSALDDAIEHQANRYTATLLMPAQLVRRIDWIGNADTMALRIANTFGVPLPVARLRMVELGLRREPVVT